MAHIVIIGAGISGLSTAFYLQQELPDAEITVIEAAPRVGGTVWTERRDGFQLEVGANGFLDTNPSTLNLCRQLGIADKLIPAAAIARNRFLFLNGKLQALPTNLWSFVRTPLLSWRGKLSLLAERFRKPGLADVDESVHDFVYRRAGCEAATIFADALVTGIHAGDPRLLSMRAAFPRIAEMERRHGSIMKGLRRIAKERRKEAAERGESHERGGRLLTFREGLRLLIETLHDRLKKPPIMSVRIRRLELVRTAHPTWVVCGDGPDRWQADAVVMVCPAYQQAAMIGDFDPQLAEQMSQIPYSPAIVVALGYPREDVPISLDGFGYIAPQRTRRDVLGVQWCSSLFPDRAPPGMVLLRAIAGGWHRRDIVSWDDDRLLRAVRNELMLAMQIQAKPVFHHIVRWEHAIPQYHLGHIERVTRIEELANVHPGLFVTGNAYYGVSLNDCTEQGEKSAARVAAYLSTR